MRGLGRIVLCALVAAVAVVAAAERAQATGGGPRIDTTAEGSWSADSSSAAGGVALTAVIAGGFLRDGVINGVLDTVGQEDGHLVFGGPITITTRHGDLYLSVTDLTPDGFDGLSGEFSTNATITGGTELLDGATGELYVHGNGDEAGVLELDEISGRIVFDHP